MTEMNTELGIGVVVDSDCGLVLSGFGGVSVIGREHSARVVGKIAGCWATTGGS